MAEFKLNLPKPKGNTLPLFDELIARKSLGVTTSSTESFNKLLGTLASGQRSRAGLEVFGKEPKPTTRKGIMATLFDHRKGYISAPFRAASSFVADIAGYDDENLREYNPIESAIRSARGDFAITGGDILKVNDGDNFVTRLGKYAGALTYDISLDPISWFGPVNIFSRKGSAILAVREGDKMLAKATALLADKGGDSGSLVSNLFENSAQYKAAKIQQKVGTAVTEGSPMALLNMTPEGAIDDAIKVSVAGKELGRQVAESLLAGGRTDVRKRLAKLLGDEDLAKDLMLSLPTDISGGFFLKRPFSGKPIARIAGGVGTEIPALKTLNALRFRVSATKPGQSLSRHFGGRTGFAYASTKKSLIGGVDRNIVDGMTVLDYVNFKDLFKDSAVSSTMLSIHANTVLSSALATSRGIVDEADRAIYTTDFETFFHHPALRPDDTASPTALKAWNAAQELRDQMRNARNTAAEAGVEIGDLGPEYVMLRYTDEEAQRLYKLGQIDNVSTTSMGVSAQYNPTKSRISNIEYHPDPEVRALLGGGIKDRPDLVALSAPEINKRAGREIYETNPIKLASAYFGAVHNATTARRFANALNASGVIFRFPMESQKVLNELEASTFLAAASKISPGAAAKAKAIGLKTRERLEEMLSAGEQAKVTTAVENRVMQAAVNYRTAKAAEAATSATLREADRAVAISAQRVTDIGPTLQQYGEAGLDTAVAEAQQVARNAQSRLSKAGRRQQEAEASADYLSSQLPLPGPEAPAPELQQWYDTLIDADATALAASRKVDDEIAAVAQSRSEAQSLREQVMSLRSTLTSEQQTAFSAYQEAVARRAQAAEAFSTARTNRMSAIDGYRAARSDTSILTATAIDTVVGAYVSARKEFSNVTRQIGKRPKNMSEQELNVYNLAKNTLSEARKLMQTTLGYTRRKGSTGVGAEYARTVVNLAEQVSEDEFVAARVLADSDALGELIGKSFGTDRQTSLNLMGDIMQMYKVIRRYVSPEDLDTLSRHEKAALSGKRQLVKGRSDLSAAARELAEGEEGGVRRIGAGKSDVGIPAAFREMYSKGGVRDVLEQIYLSEQNPREWEKFISRVYDPLALIWKTGATVGRGPAYTVTNTTGGLYNNFLGRVSAKSHILSAEMLYNVQKIIREVRKDFPNKSYFEMLDVIEDRLRKVLGNRKIGDQNVVDLYKNFLLRGGHFSSDNFFQTQELSRLGLEVRAPLERVSGVGPRFTGAPDSKVESEFRTVATWVLTNPAQRALNDVAQASELWVRFAAFADGYERFGNVKSAMDLAHMLHFDYQDLSGFELWVKRIVPFYTWTRNNVPLQFRMMFIGSDQISKIFNANAEAKAAFGLDGDAEWLDQYLPDYMDTTGGFLTYIKFGGNHLGLFPKLPLQDLDKALMTAYIGKVPYPVPRVSELVNMLGPAPKTLTELITQRNFEYGYEYEGPVDLLKGQVRNLIPYAGTAQRVASGVGFGQQERRWTNLLNFLVGAPYGTTTFTEKQLRSGAIRKSRAESEQLNLAAAEAGVDVKWLRKEINKGTTTQELRTKIVLGEGKITQIEMEKRMKKYFGGESEVREDYNEILQGLRRGR